MTRRGRVGSKYQPWRHDRAKATRAVAIGAAAVVLGAVLFRAGATTAGITAFAVGVIAIGSAGRHAKRADARAFGKQIEAQSTALAVDYLSQRGIAAHANVMHRAVGDIDLLIGGDHGQPGLPVEIKSFRHWRQAFFVTGQRERDAIDQTRRQMRAVGASVGLIWLPQGKPTLWQWIFGAGSGPVRVVFGSERALARAACNRMGGVT